MTEERKILKLSDLFFDKSIYPRAEMSIDIIEHYTEAMRTLRGSIPDCHARS
jgi:hypothetical protein